MPTVATYLVQTADSALPNAQATGALATGLVLNTTTTGVLSAYGGTSCTNQFPRSLSGSGAATCASVADADLTGQVGVAHGGTGLATTTTGDVILGGNGTAAMTRLADVAVGSALVSGGVGAAPGYSATGTCTSSASTTCTITGRRSGCLPVCSMTTSVSTTFRAAISTTTITCTFGTSGTNTCPATAPRCEPRTGSSTWTAGPTTTASPSARTCSRSSVTFGSASHGHSTSCSARRRGPASACGLEPPPMQARVLWVLNWHRQAGLSPVLIEWGFATSPEDAELLKSPEVRLAQVACAAAGIARAIELTHQQPAAPAKAA